MFSVYLDMLCSGFGAVDNDHGPAIRLAIQASRKRRVSSAKFKRPVGKDHSMLKAKAFDGAFGIDVAKQMNEFFEENPDLGKDSIHHLQIKMGRAYNSKTEEVDTHVTALVVYDETAKDRATRGTQ